LDKLQAEKGISSSSVFVGGFSMGGGMALEFLARHHPVQLAGVFGFGSFLATGSSV
jgi:predicted esterase